MIFALTKKIRVCLFILTLTGLFCSSVAEAVQSVRVLVSENQKMIKVNITGEYVVRVLPSQKVAKKGRAMKNVWVVPTPKGMRIGKEEWECQGIRIEPLKDRDLLLQRTRFRGVVSILKDTKGLLYTINTLDLESYLYGVLHHEVAPWWPMEGLKAQAVAARTYAVYEALVSKSAEYDLKSSTSSQVYGGSTTERYRSKRAIDLTAGQILTYQGKVFPAFFHATCAGLTAGSTELWKIPFRPIDGGVQCNYCKISPHYNWESRVSLAEIEEKARKYGRDCGQIIKIELLTQTPSHRVGSLRITGTKAEIVVAAKDFRVWIGGNKLRSTAFTIETKEDTVYFHGRGWGHGVGLCQWGTLGQAITGRRYEDILTMYYPESEISDISSAVKVIKK